MDLRFGWSPSDTVISIGQTFTARLDLYGCAGTRRLTDGMITWKSDDSTIAAADSASGVVTGRQQGTTRVIGTSHHYGLSVPVIVTVR